MIYEYKLACIEAGLSAEEIKEIEQVFDTEYKRNQYEQVKKDNTGMDFLHLEGMIGRNGEIGNYEIEDTGINIEEDFIHRCDLCRLRELLAELSEEDREFLMDCFNHEKDYIVRLMEKHHMTKSAVRWKRDSLVKLLRTKFSL